jgi:hypothetical protein
MPTPRKRYQQEMYENLGFFATWLPGDLIELGEVGLFKDGQFKKASSLSELGIDFEFSPTGTSQALQYTSSSGTTVNSSAGAGIANVATAEISVEFSSEGAFLMHASGVRQKRIKDRSALHRAILKSYERGTWNKDWYIVETLHEADCATIIISNKRSSGLVLAASSHVPLGSLPLANPKADLSIKSTRGSVLQLIAAKKLKPLYSCLRVRDPWFQKPYVESVRGIGEKGAVSFERPSIDDLLGS